MRYQILSAGVVNGRILNRELWIDPTRVLGVSRVDELFTTTSSAQEVQQAAQWASKLATPAVAYCRFVKPFVQSPKSW